MKALRKLCGDPVGDALRAIGRTAPRTRPPSPADFTAEERFRMFRAVLHGQVYPMRDLDVPGRWSTRRVFHTVRSWSRSGRRGFIREVRAAAAAEVRQADYADYDLAPLRNLIGEDGPVFCRMLSALDAAEMERRMRGMEADLSVLTRRMSRARPHTEGTFRYRIALYEQVFEAVIRKGMGEWIRNLVN